MSRRARPLPKKLLPEEQKITDEEVVVDLKAAVMLKPEARPKWLGKASKMVVEGKASSTDLFDIIVNRKFAAGLPERVRRKLVVIVLERLDIFSDKQQRYLNSPECVLMSNPVREATAELEGESEFSTAGARVAMLADSAMERVLKAGAVAPPAVEREDPEVSKWQIAQDEAAVRRHRRESEEMAQRNAARREEKRRREAMLEDAARQQAADEEAARRRKLEDEADALFSRALTLQEAPGREARDGRRDRSRSVSRASRSISSRTARRLARADRERRAGARQNWQRSMPPSELSGSRAIFMNRDFQEDLPHLPRPNVPGTTAVPRSGAERSRERSAGRRRRRSRS